MHLYANDTQLYQYKLFYTFAHQVASIESCTHRIRNWLLWTMVFISTHRSLNPLLFSTQGPNNLSRAESIPSTFHHHATLLIKNFDVSVDFVLQAGIWNMQSVLLSHLCPASNSISPRGLQDEFHSYFWLFLLCTFNAFNFLIGYRSGMGSRGYQQAPHFPDIAGQGVCWSGWTN